MKTVILGGSGFLGSHVADNLTLAGHDVIIYDQVQSPWLKDDQTMLVGDLMDSNAISETIQDSDVVYNFAAIADLDEALNKPIDTVKVNILGNVQVLEACRVAEIKRYVYASTVYVYSRDGGFYRCSKQAAEHYVEEYQRSYKLDYTILRYGSLYGPRSDYRNGLFRIVKNALETGNISYEGSPEAIREYIHVEDAARASVDALKDEFRNQHVILSGHQPLRVLDLLKILAEILGKEDSSINFVQAEHTGHYVRTPYAYLPKIGRKYTSTLHVDLGQGLLQLIDEIQRNN